MNKQADKIIRAWRDYEGNIVQFNNNFNKAIKTGTVQRGDSDAHITHKALKKTLRLKKENGYVRK